MWMRAPVFVTFRTTQSMTEDVPRVTFAPLRMCARSATPFSAATVLHDSSQDVGDHIGAGANGYLQQHIGHRRLWTDIIRQTAPAVVRPARIAERRPAAIKPSVPAGKE
jgi:hypothetical protein